MQEKSLGETKSSYQYSFPIAVVLTVIIIVFSVLIWTGVLHIPASPYESRDEQGYIGFSITDFGTYVSGVFTSLSFIWLVVNALQQREDLRLQREEMRENNEQQKRQAKQLKKAAKLSLQNSKIQKEILANEKLQPHLQTIYVSLMVKSAAVRVKVNDSLSKELLEIIGSKFRPDTNGNFVIHLFLTGNAVNLIQKEKDHSDPLNIVSTINHSMVVLWSNLEKMEPIISQEPYAFKFFIGAEYIDDLKNLFNELERILAMLEPNHASSLRSLYKLDNAKKCFQILERIPR